MLHVQTITSLDLPELTPYRTMRWHNEHQQQGIFVAEGEKVVRRLLESHFTVVSVVLPPPWLPKLEPLLNARPEPDIRVFLADKKVLEQLVGFSMYQGLLAVGQIPARATLATVLQTSACPRLFAAVDALTNAENLGVLVRNCVAFGAQALLVGETCTSPYLRRSVRSSMGAIFKLPVVETASLAETLRDLRAHGIRGVAAHPRGDGRTLAQADLAGDCCVVFGSEGYGVSAPVLAACTEAVGIPMAGGVDSLNVGSASAAFLYEACRQRGKM